MSRFFPLRVSHVERLTRDSVALTLQPEDDDRARFAFTPGQYLTLRRAFDGVELRRCYSICAAPDEGRLRVGIKQVAGGAFSTFANTTLAIGDIVEAMPPMGRFGETPDPAAKLHHVAFAGGSGITPILSIIASTLKGEPGSRVTLVYVNRSAASIMFREALEDLKNQHLGRLQILQVLTGEGQDIELLSGRLDEARCTRLLATLIPPKGIDRAYICGPVGMAEAIETTLLGHGVAREKVRIERFAGIQSGRAPQPAAAHPTGAGEMCSLSVTLDGVTHALSMPRRGQSVLEAARAADIDAPFACQAGVCSTCRARLLEGEVEMAANHALEDYEVRRGDILTCQSHPLTASIAITYDH